MTTSGKPEINLEVYSGFFRISTEEAVYNITVMDSREGGAIKVVEKIVETEKSIAPPAEAALSGLEALEKASLESVEGDNYYKEVSRNIYHEIGQLAKSLSNTIIEIPAEDRKQKRAELDEAGEKIEDAKSQLKDIVAMTEEATMAIMDNVESVLSQTDGVRDLLSFLKTHQAFSNPIDENASSKEEGDTEKPQLAEWVQDIQQKIRQAREMLTAMQEESGPGEGGGEEPAAAKKTIYRFDLDTVFQTIYELCTNETVKGHISETRKKADTVFDKEKFQENLTERVASLEPDADNFLTVPLSDIFQSLLAVCSEKAITNLLKKMDSGQSTIFLDQSVPLELPPAEEVVGAEADSEPAQDGEEKGGGAPEAQLGELDALLEGSLEGLDTLEQGVLTVEDNCACLSQSIMTSEDRGEIFSKIEIAFEDVSNISGEVSKILEALSFQDLSGQRILKIIKLLSDFQVHLLAIVVSFGSQLKLREKDAKITAEESKKLAQEEVDSYINMVTVPEEDTEERELDQSAVNNMLENLGF